MSIDGTDLSTSLRTLLNVASVTNAGAASILMYPWHEKAAFPGVGWSIRSSEDVNTLSTTAQYHHFEVLVEGVSVVSLAQAKAIYDAVHTLLQGWSGSSVGGGTVDVAYRRQPMPPRRAPTPGGQVAFHQGGTYYVGVQP